jgi:hypothetical protein
MSRPRQTTTDTDEAAPYISPHVLVLRESQTEMMRCSPSLPWYTS